jgi:hypothetical protein
MLPLRYCLFPLAFSVWLFAVHAVHADAWDPADDTGTTTETLITISEIAQTHGPHTLDAADTNDWFKVELIAGVPCRIESTGSIDTEAFLYSDASGTIELAHDDQSGTNDNFRLIYFPDSSGTRYLKVKEYLSGTGGSYTLQYGFYAADAWDPMDDNGMYGTVLTMGEAAKVHGPHALDPFDHVDWYRIYLLSGSTYRFKSTGPIDTDTWGGIYADPSDPSDEAAEIYNDDGPDDLNFQLDFPVPVSGDYYLKVRAYNEQDYTAYNLYYYIPANDSDGDQLLDTWEEYYFGNLNGGPATNTDHDALTDLEEYVAGSDPTDPDSFFAVTNWATGSFVLNWSSLAGREYRVYWTDHLTHAFQQQGPALEHPQNAYTDTVHDAESAGFYKVEVQLK